LFRSQAGLRERVDGFAGIGAGEVVTQGFPLLAEAEAYECDEGVRIGDAEFGGARAGVDADDGRVDFGRRMEGAGLDREEQGNGSEERGVDGEETVIARAGLRGEPLRHLLLDEEDAAAKVGAYRQDLFHDRRGDVVRQVAGDDRRTPAGEVGLQDVGADDFEIGGGGEFGAQVVGETGVDFDGDDAAGALNEFRSEGAAAGADFDDERLAPGAGRGGDALEDGAADQEVLAEFLAGQ